MSYNSSSQIAPFSRTIGLVILTLISPVSVLAAVGDPQIKTTHPWYPGELSCSTFERLFQTQAEVYQRVMGKAPVTDEEKAIASWYWRNLHFAHGEDGRQDCFNIGFVRAETNREYWTGLFAHGFALCGTTHGQYTVEMNALLGHGRGRIVGVDAHNSFEAFIEGGVYQSGQWVLLDHDLSTVIFSRDGKRLLSIPEVVADSEHLTNPAFRPDRQHGWLVSGLDSNDAKSVYRSFESVEYFSGYAGPPPMVTLRRGESMRRYLEPGLEDGKTFVYWGRNYQTGSIPGPTRDRTWINQPEKMYNSKTGAGSSTGRVRYANVVYDYRPNFADESYKEGVVMEDDTSVTFEFRTPYVIAATASNDSQWGIYDADAKNGLILHGSTNCSLQLSVDNGKSWTASMPLKDETDLTDFVKGFNQYWLRFNTSAQLLIKSNLRWRTVCQANVTTIPRLVDGVNSITYFASGTGIVSAGPTKPQSEAMLVSDQVNVDIPTLRLTTPRGERPTQLYAISWNLSGAPPAPVTYQIEYSMNGKDWQPVVKDWKIIHRPPEPKDFWSQSFTYGDIELPQNVGHTVFVRFRNDGHRKYKLVQAHLAYEVVKPTPLEATFAWTEHGGQLIKTASHIYNETKKEVRTWKFVAGKDVKTKWIELRVK